MRTAILSIVAVAFLGGCSSFEKDYEQAKIVNGSVEGPWSGTWTSEQGHGSGKLRAIIKRTGDQTFQARFKATFWGFLTSEEQVDLKATSDNPVRAGGSKDLGWLAGGLFQYDATLTPERFTATYRSVNDHGVFDLSRSR